MKPLSIFLTVVAIILLINSTRPDQSMSAGLSLGLFALAALLYVVSGRKGQ